VPGAVTKAFLPNVVGDVCPRSACRERKSKGAAGSWAAGYVIMTLRRLRGLRRKGEGGKIVVVARVTVLGCRRISHRTTRAGLPQPERSGLKLRSGNGPNGFQDATISGGNRGMAAMARHSGGGTGHRPSRG